MRTPTSPTSNEVKLGQNIQRLVKSAKDYDGGIAALDKIQLPDGFKLSIHAITREEASGLGAESYLFISTPSGEIFTDKQKEFWRFLSVENSPSGAWQIFLLYNLWHYLPMFWHAFYEDRVYLYSSEQLDLTLPYLPRFAEEPLPPFDTKPFDLTPKIFQSENIWHVGACFWTDFGGLIYEELKINLSGKVHVYAQPARRKTLYRYDCGICF